MHSHRIHAAPVSAAREADFLGPMKGGFCQWPLSLSKRSIGVLVAAVCLVCGPIREAANASTTAWNRETFGYPQPPVSESTQTLKLSWQEVPLRDALARFAATHGTPIFVERRVDPNMPLTLRAEGNAGELLRAIASENDLGVTTLAGVYVVGPAADVSLLRTAHARAHARLAKLSATAQRRLGRSQSLVWPRLSTAQAVLEQATASLPGGVVNLERLPHDLWPAGQLPSAPLHEQLSLILFGFGLDWRANATGEAIQLMPLARPVAITARHKVPNNSEPLTKSILAVAPTATQSADGAFWTVQGRAEQHEQVAALLRGDRPTSRPQPAPDNSIVDEIADLRFTLTVSQQPAGAIIRQLASSLDLQLVADSATLDNAARISFEVSQASLDELLAKIGNEASLSIELVGKSIIVTGGAAQSR